MSSTEDSDLVRGEMFMEIAPVTESSEETTPVSVSTSVHEEAMANRISHNEPDNILRRDLICFP